MSIKKILDLNPNEINKMSLKEKNQLAKQAATYARTRIRNLNDYSQSHPNYPKPPALRRRREGGRKEDVVWAEYDFTYKANMTDNELRAFIAKTRQFLRTKTSTVEGWQKYVRDFKKRLDWRVGKRLTRNQFETFWDVYSVVSDNDFSKYQIMQGQSEDLQEYVKDIVEESSISNLDETAQRIVTDLDIRGAYEEGMSLPEFIEDLKFQYERYKIANPNYGGTFSEWRLKAYDQDPTHREWNNPVEFYFGEDDL